jgi:hypothetical protein
VADMQAGARRVRKHIEHIVVRFVGFIGNGINAVFIPSILPLFLNL